MKVNERTFNIEIDIKEAQIILWALNSFEHAIECDGIKTEFSPNEVKSLYLDFYDIASN